MKRKIKQNRLDIGRIALERLVGALINCSSRGREKGSQDGTKEFTNGLH